MKRLRKTFGASVLLTLLVPVTTFAQGLQLTNTYNLPGGSISGIVTNFLNWLLVLFGIFGILGFVISGIIYLVSAGDENMITRAKSAMVWSIVGIIVGLAGFVIMQAVFSFLSGNNNQF